MELAGDTLDLVAAAIERARDTVQRNVQSFVAGPPDAPTGYYIRDYRLDQEVVWRGPDREECDAQLENIRGREIARAAVAVVLDGITSLVEKRLREDLKWNQK